MKTVECVTCQLSFDPNGVARHRAMHRDRHENCTLVFLKVHVAADHAAQIVREVFTYEFANHAEGSHD